jgi:tubulin polyglutamylase TTLL9
MKPVAKSQGKGIFLFQKLSDISDWRNCDRSASKSEGNSTAPAGLYIVQQYISNPYLVGGEIFEGRFIFDCNRNDQAKSSTCVSMYW